ncbi:MAG: hypothetical protein IJO04_05020 [Oscillospiraceae bacterium]|nr:hypothetical protein [Oscillospiraceae bacterium]
MSDAKIVFNTEIDNSDVQKGMNAAKREIKKATKSLETAENAKLPLLRQVESLGARLDEAKAKLAALQKQQAVTDQALNGGDPGAYIEAYAKKPELDAAVLQQTEQVDRLQKEWDQVNDKLDKYNQQIDQANNTIAEQKKIAGDLSAKLTSGGNSMAKATEKADKSASKFQKRMTGIVKQVFMFGLVSKALSGVVDYMGKALRSNEEFSKELSKLKGALLTAFQPLYEAAMPALLMLLKIITAVAQGIVHIFSLLSGKSASEYSENAKALYEQATALEAVGNAAKKAAKDLAGFDEINRLSSGETSNTAAITPDFELGEFSNFLKELTLGIKAKIEELAFDWNEGTILQSQDAWIIVLTGILGAVIGGMFGGLSGAIIGLLLGLSIGLISCTFLDDLENAAEAKSIFLAVLLAILGTVIGSIFGGVAGGAIGLVVGLSIGLATIAFNDELSNETRETAKVALCAIIGAVIGAIFGAGVFGGIIGGVIGLVFGLAITIDDVSFGDASSASGFPGRAEQLAREKEASDTSFIESATRGALRGAVKVPGLARGAVLPPNREFLAVVGDQKHGTNIEAPLATIQEAVALVMGDQTAAILAGFEASVGVQREILEAVLGIQIGDDVIGQATARYNRKLAASRGGA